MSSKPPNRRLVPSVIKEAGKGHRALGCLNEALFHYGHSKKALNRIYTWHSS